MSEASIALFGRKGGAGSGSGQTQVTEKQAKQKRQASHRNTLIKKAPEHVQQKWAAICALKGRDRAKNEKKQEFLQVLLKDPSYQDNYWQLSVMDRYTVRSATQGRWVMREKAEQEHGGGSTGRTAIDNGIKCGIFEEKFITGSDGTQISQVKMVEDTEDTAQTLDITRKTRTGQSMDAQGIKSAMADIVSSGEDVRKRPSSMLAITDGSADNPGNDKKASTKSRRKDVVQEIEDASDHGQGPMKKPAAATSSQSSKKEKAGNLTEDRLKQLEQEQNEQTKNRKIELMRQKRNRFGQQTILGMYEMQI